MIFKLTSCTCELSEPKIEKLKVVTYLMSILKFWPPPPTWHQINFETHKNAVNIFILHISRYIHNLYTYKVWRKLKDTFDYRPIPSVEAFSRFQNGKFPPVNWKCQTLFSNHNKMDESSPLSWIKHLQGFKKSSWKRGFWKFNIRSVR